MEVEIMLFDKNKKDEVKNVNTVLTNAAFTQLHVKLTDLDLAVVSGDHFEIRYRGAEDKKPSVTQTGDAIELKEPKVERRNGKIWQKKLIKVELVTTDDIGKVTVVIPKDHKLNQLDVDLTSGDAKMQDLLLNDLKYSSASGDLKIETVQVQKLKIEVTSGDVKLRDVGVSTGKIDLISGDFKMEDSNISDNLTVATTSGDNVVENTEVDQCDLSTVSGDNSIFSGQNTHAQIGKEINGSHLKMSTLSGDNTVR